MTSRLALALVSAGMLSAALETHFLREPAPNAVWLFGSVTSLGAAILAARRDPYAWAIPGALTVTVAGYGLFLLELGAGGLAVAAYALVALAAAFAVPRERRPLAVAAVALWIPALHLFGPQASSSAPSLVALAAAASLPVAVALLRSREGASGPALLAVAASAAVADRHLVVGGTGPDDALLLLIVVGAPLLALSRRRDAIATALGLLLFASLCAALIAGKPYHVDSVTVPHYAAELLLAGHDPYAAFDLRDAMRRFGLEGALLTHLEDLSELRTLSYPALSFLAVTPFVALGLPDIRPLYAVALGLLVPLLSVRLRLAGPLVVAAILGNVVLLRQHVLAGIDPLWIALIAVAFLFPERRLLSAAALGLALADRQQAWAMAPFVILAAWRTYGPREAGLRGAVACAVALAVDLPFLVADPAAFIGGVLGPILQPLQPYGVGLVRAGWTPFTAPLPRAFYGALTAGAFPVLFAVVWILWRRWPALARVAGTVPLWLAWRSLLSYLDAAPLLALPRKDRE